MTLIGKSNTKLHVFAFLYQMGGGGIIVLHCLGDAKQVKDTGHL